MVLKQGFRRWAGAALGALILCGCASQVEPAQKSISDIEAALSAAVDGLGRHPTPLRRAREASHALTRGHARCETA